MSSPPEQRWYRRFIAQVTTPFLAGLLWAAMGFAGSDQFRSYAGATIALCYLVWLLSGAPVRLFFRRGSAKSVWWYAGWGVSLGALPFFHFAFDPVDSGEWRSLGFQFAAIGGITGFWYWFCAYWRPARTQLRAAAEAEMA